MSRLLLNIRLRGGLFIAFFLRLDACAGTRTKCRSRGRGRRGSRGRTADLFDSSGESARGGIAVRFRATVLLQQQRGSDAFRRSLVQLQCSRHPIKPD